LSRRRLFAEAGTAAICVAAASQGAFSAAGASHAALIDVHTHLTQGWIGSTAEPVTATHLLHWMDEHGVERAAVLPLVSPEAFWYPVTTEYVLSQTAPHRDRLVPFCAIDPRTLATHLAKPQRVQDLLNRYRDAGAKGLGEHKPRLAIDDPLSMRLYEACAAVGLPLLLHLDNEANMDKPGLPGFDRVASAFPELTLIGHGKGWWASIAGGISQADLQIGYPRGPVAPGGAIDALMDRHRNVYGDLSSSGAHALLRDPAFGGEFLRRRADRLLFGTDYYDRAQLEWPHFTLFDTLGAPADVRQKVGSENAKRILKL
jgi:predicted TIM-barrel fold metal-dependent hydrolase